MPSVQKSKGLSLIELLVVISVVSILTTVGVAMFRTAQAKGRDSIRKTNLQHLSLALEGYLQKYGSYVGSVSRGGTSLDCTTDTGNFYSAIAPYITGIVPTDPLDQTKQYCYLSINNGSSYRLFAKLENCQDSEVINQSTCATDNFNYSRTSPDLTVTPAP